MAGNRSSTSTWALRSIRTVSIFADVIATGLTATVLAQPDARAAMLKMVR